MGVLRVLVVCDRRSAEMIWWSLLVYERRQGPRPQNKRHKCRMISNAPLARQPMVRDLRRSAAEVGPECRSPEYQSTPTPRH